MDSNKFGVKLKSTGGGVNKDKIISSSLPPGRRNTGTKAENFKDIKKKFDADVKDEKVADKVGKAGFREKTKVETNGGIKLENRFQRGDIKRSSLEKKPSSGTTVEGEPQVAVGKVFTRQSSQTFQATVENKLKREESPPSPRDKSTAASFLATNLALIRTRPGSGGKKDGHTTSETKTSTAGKWGAAREQSSPKLTKKPSSGTLEFGLSFVKKTDSDNSLKSVGSNLQRQSSSDSSDGTSPRSVSSLDSVGLDRKNVQKLNSILGLDATSSGVKSEVKNVSSLSSVSKAKTVVSSHSDSKPVSSVNAFSGNSVGLSQTNKSKAKTWQDSKTKYSSFENKEEEKPEWMDKSKEMVSKFQTKLRKPIISKIDDSGFKTKSSATMPSFNKPLSRTSSSETKTVSSVSSFETKTSTALSGKKAVTSTAISEKKFTTSSAISGKKPFMNTAMSEKSTANTAVKGKTDLLENKSTTTALSGPKPNTTLFGNKTTHVAKSQTKTTTTKTITTTSKSSPVSGVNRSTSPVISKFQTTDINSNKMTTKSLEPKFPNVLKSADLSDTGSDISSRSSELSASSWRRDDRDDSADNIPSDIKPRRMATHKMDANQFKKIKGNFEQKTDSAGSSDSSTVRKLSNPKIAELSNKPLCLRGAKNIVERRSSFENPPSSPPPQPRNATLRVLREAGKIPNVKAVAQDINTTGRVRSSSLGSVELPKDYLYNEILGVEDYKSKEWPTFSDSDYSDDLYEPIGPERSAFIKEQSTAGGSISNWVPTRRMGQKRKGTHKPGYQEQSSSEGATEGSSKEGTLESADDRGGIEADAENDSDSSNSGIYEPVDKEWAAKFKSEGDRLAVDIPPELPADRKKKKKPGKTGAKALGKLKKFYKPKKSNNEHVLKTVVSAPVLSTVGAVSSSGVLNKLGDKLKKIKKTKTDDVKSLDDEVVIDSSDYNLSDSESTPAMNLQDIEYIDTSSLEQDSKRTLPPPLPPRTGPSPIPPEISSGGSDEDHRSPPPLPAARMSHDNEAAPAIPPRKSMLIHVPPEAEVATPALPPRNSHRISTNLDINMVVPVSPGITGAPSNTSGDPRKWNASKESYLHGHVLNQGGSFDADVVDNLPPAPPPPLIRDDSNPYIQHDPKSDEDEKHRDSSGYMKVGSPGDNSPSAMSQSTNVPFDQLMMFRSQYDKEEDNIYLDLEDEDQLYGRLDQRYEPKIYAEHLYQYYDKDKVDKASNRKCAVIVDSDEEEDVGDRIYEEVPEIVEKQTSSMDSRGGTVSSKSSTLDTFTKKGSILRSFWCEMQEVKNSGLLEKLSSQDKKIQEAMFEIITSEATYLRSLNVLIDVFLMSPEFSAEHSDRCIITRQERHVIFSNIGAVREASERFLADLESKWQKSVMLDGVCEAIDSHASRHFECYVRYCSNQTFQERQVSELMKKPEFLDTMRRMEKDPSCQGLPMMSFLLLPMQRITRLPLLVDAICHRMEPATERHKAATRALTALNKVVRRCNEGARRMQQTEQMCHLVQNLEFKVKEIPLVSASRYLIKQGELTRILPDASSRIPLRKKIKQTISIFLFNDVLLICKKKSTQYVVTDYALRNVLQVESIDGQEKSRFLPNGAPSGCKNIFVIVLLENHEQKMVELILSCKSPSDKTRWIDALSPVAREDDSEKIYEEWDCPQVQCTKKHVATEPDELTLEESDVVNVFKKMNDGWYEGERIRDGERGWFIADHTEEIINSHVRARNLRLRYRLLLASDNYGTIDSVA